MVLAPQLPEVWLEALEAARNIGDEYLRARALGDLAPQLPEALWSEALEAARNIGDEYSRARALGNLAPQLPEVWPEALEAARSIGSESLRAIALGKLIPRLTPSSIDFPFWKRILHALASLNRPHLVSNIPQLAPLIIHFGEIEGLRKIVNAIGDVSRWWK